MSKTMRACIFVVIVVLVCGIASSQSWAEGTVRGEARFEIIKGQPQMGYKDLFEWNLFLSPTSSPPVGPHRRLGGDTGNGDYIVENMPAGVYSIFVNQPIFFVRPVVVPNVIIRDGETTLANVEVPIDFSTYVLDDWTGPSNEWFQTYTATGTAVTGIGFVVAGTTASSIEVAVLEDNGEPEVRDWLELGSRLRKQVAARGDQWVRWRSGEIPTIPGKRYAVRLRSADGENFQPMMRNKDGNSYGGGRAYNRDGTPQNFDLNVTVFVDNDGTVVTMNKRECCLGSLQTPNYGQRWAQTFTAQGTSLAGVDLWAAGANGIWDLDFEWRVHDGGPDGPIIGPTKITKAGFQASGVGLHGASFNPGDVALIPGQTYSVEVVISNPPSKSNGFNPMVMDNDSYDGGIAYQYVGTTWFAKPDTDLSMTLLEYVDTPEIDLSTNILTPTTESGVNPASDTFTVQNVGDATLHYSVSKNVTWLDVTPTNGSSTGEADAIAVDYFTENLPAGIYTATITVSDPLATNDPQTIDVNLTVHGSAGCVTLSLENGNFENGCNGWTGYCSGSSTIWNPGPIEGSGWGSVQSGGAREPWFSWQTVPAESIPTTLTGFMADGSHENHDHVVQLIDGDENGTVMDEFRRNNEPGSSHEWVDFGVLSGTPKSGRVTVKFGWIPNSLDWSAGTATHVDALELLQCSPALPQIGLAPRTLNPEAEEGNSPSPDTFTVYNSGDGSLSYEVSADVDWLSLTPSSGTSTGGQDTITVQYSTSGLAQGTHHATITVSDPNAGNNPQTLAVTVTITEPSACVNGSLVNADFEGGLSNWNVFGRTDGVQESPFHNVTAESGIRMFGAGASWETKNGGAYQRVDVCEGAQIEASASIYTNQVGGGDWDVSCRLGIDPTGGTDPSSEDILWTEWTDSARAWSRIGLTGDEAVITESDAVTLFIEHRHKWALRFNLTIFDNVTFAATSTGLAPEIVVSPKAFNREVDEGSNLTPDTFVIQNVGDGTLNYSVSVDADWMSVSPSQGSITGGQDTITLSYSTPQLVPGTYTGHVTISDPNASNDPQTIDVTLEVLAVSTCTAVVPSTDWKGKYFSNSTLTGTPTMVRNDGNGFLNFEWYSDNPSPDCGMPADDFSVRWTRTVDFEAGTYRFTVTSDDGFRLFVDGDLKLEKWFDQAPTIYTVDLPLTTGNHELELEYYEHGGWAVAKLSWEAVSSPCISSVASDRWRGEYFDNRNLSGIPVMVRDDGSVGLNFDWGGGSPNRSCGVPDDNFSVRWTRTANFGAGSYRFTMTSDDGFRLYVDGGLELESWIDQAPTTYTVDVPLSAGNHTLRLDYYENRGGAYAALAWERQAASGLPDVVVESISISPSNPRPGEDVMFSALVKNVGDSPTPTDQVIGVSYSVVEDGTELDRTWGSASGPLEPGATLTIGTSSASTAGPWNARAGKFTIYADVDDVDRFEESDEDNNVSYITITVDDGSQDTAHSKIGFHVGPGGNQNGLGDWMRTLDAAGIPFFLKSVDSAGQIYEAVRLREVSGVPHVLVYRKSGSTSDVPNYDLPPQQAAQEHWQHHRSAFPPELESYKHMIWLETINEVDKNRAEWLAEFAYHTALLAMNDGFNWAAFGWSSGEPEPEHWEEPQMLNFLSLAAQYPDRIAVALHEYSFTTDSLDEGYPYMVGRFQTLFDVADRHGFARPTVLITEFGWTFNNVPNPDDAMVHLRWADELYEEHSEIKGAAIWYLGPGFGGISDKAQKLIVPVTDYALQKAGAR